MTGPRNSRSVQTGTPIIEGFAYRRDIDGLRAIAVLAVLFFHADLGWPGGYVGVDVFFAISGYLITSLIVKDLEKSSFSLLNFWERRVRRLWPPLFAVGCASLLAGWFLLLPGDYGELGRSTIWQTLLGANLFFWREGGYFAGAAEAKPLLHTWSLAIEEQFYLLLPMLLLGVVYAGKLTRSTLVFLLALITSLSFMASIYGVVNHPSATFYLLPTRAWELGLGSLLAVLPLSRIRLNPIVRDGISLAGLLGILVPCFYYDRATTFPGLSALPPCIGTVLLVWANTPLAGGTPGLIARMLSSRALVGIGLISYSLYLWHWPLFAFTRYWSFGEPDPARNTVLLLLSVTMAMVSWKWIEQPFRSKKLFHTRRGIFSSALCGSVLIIMSSGLVIHQGGIPKRLPKAARHILAETQERMLNREKGQATSPTTIDDIRNNQLPVLGQDGSGQPAFVLWGDSHAKAAIPAFESLARNRGITGYSAILYSTPPLVSFDPGLKHRVRNADEFAGALFDFIERNKVEQVYLCAFWSLYVRNRPVEDFATAFKETINRLNDMGVHVTVLLDVPTHEIDVPKAMVGQHMLPFLRWQIEGCTAEEHRIKNAFMYDLAAQVDPGLDFIDPAPALLDPSALRYVVMREGTPLYYDNNHLTKNGAVSVLLPLLEQFGTNDRT